MKSFSLSRTAAACGMLLAFVRAAPFNETLIERETPASTCYTQESYTQLVGDGDPHIDLWTTQVSNTVICDNEPGCTSGYSQATTIGWSFDAGFDLGSPEFTDGGGAVGLSLGYSIEESYETGTSEQCPGPANGSTCVWYYAPYAAYTVENVVKDSCGGVATSTPYVMRAPLTTNHYYCVEYTCRTYGEGYWTLDIGTPTNN